MASTTANQQATVPPAAPGRLKRIILFVLIALIAAGAAGGGTWFYLSRHAPAAVAHAAAPVPPALPVFFPLEPMTVNLLSDDGEQHYLRIGLTLKLADAKYQQTLTEHMPEVRSRLLLALSNKHPEDLATLDGKHALASELKTLIEQPTDKGAPPIQIESVLFTDFVVQ